jgi:hypothetical protein
VFYFSRDAVLQKLPQENKIAYTTHEAHEHRGVSLFPGKGKFKMPAQKTLEAHDTEDILGHFSHY